MSNFRLISLIDFIANMLNMNSLFKAEFLRHLPSELSRLNSKNKIIVQLTLSTIRVMRATRVISTMIRKFGSQLNNKYSMTWAKVFMHICHFSMQLKLSVFDETTSMQSHLFAFLVSPLDNVKKKNTYKLQRILTNSQSILDGNDQFKFYHGKSQLKKKF